MAPVPNECLNLLNISEAFDDFDARSDGSVSKDSGIDHSDTEFVPDEDLIAKIVEQVEYYFSDEHLVKDAFLLKHVRKNRNGFISLKLITSFKKVKHITKDWQTVAHACRFSNKLQLNEEATKVRRVDPVPDLDETIPSRTVVAIGVHESKATIELLAEVFKSCGSIVQLRIVRPDTGVPQDVRHTANKHPEMFSTVSAVVEFERSDSARAALRLDNIPAARVVEMAPRRFRKLKTQEKSPKLIAPLTNNNPVKPGSTNRALPSKPEVRHVEKSSPQPTARSPWMQQRLLIKAEMKSNANNRLNVASNVIRQPFGPDGTRGFHARKQQD